MNRYFLLVSFCLAIISFKPDDQFSQLNQLEGFWEDHTANTRITEIWEIKNKNLMYGAFFYATAYTLIMERMWLERTGNEIYYIEDNEEESRSLMLKFRLIEHKSNLFRFENKQNDSPRSISYSFINADSVIRRRESVREGKIKVEEYHLKKSDYKED